MAQTQLWQWQFGPAGVGARLELDKSPIAFSQIAGWTADDHTAAFGAFRQSCKGLLAQDDADQQIRALCEQALSAAGRPSSDEARVFFETNFRAYAVARPETGAMVTGYYEPDVRGSLDPSDEFPVPVYALPDDLALLAPDENPEGLATDLTAVRHTSDGPVPYYTRQEIEEGALHGRGLELAFLADPCEAFVMQVQGSGRIRLPDGSALPIGFAGKNGHPYTSIGKVLVERGELDPAAASLGRLLEWLRADPQRGRRLMWENKSYPFFRIRDGAADASPTGALGAPLTPGRSLAVDPRYHRLGLPIWVSAPDLTDMSGDGFTRLMIAQDTGSAIRGPVRGDVYWGSGEEAGRIAGITRHTCDFHILIPN